MLGTLAGIGALYAASVAASLVALAVPPAYVALLGVVPLAIGIKQLLERGEERPARPSRGGVLAVAGINIALGGDNIGVYTPLFATASAAAILVYGVVFALLAGAMCLAAQRLVAQPALGAPIGRWGRRVMPFVLIALGAWILLGF